MSLYKNEKIAVIVPSLDITRTRLYPNNWDTTPAILYTSEDNEQWDILVENGYNSIWVRKRGTHFWFHVEMQDLIGSMIRVADKFLIRYMEWPPKN